MSTENYQKIIKKAYKAKLMINITNKIKQDKNRQYRKNHLNVIHHNNDLNRSCELNIYLSLYYHDQYINC